MISPATEAASLRCRRSMDSSGIVRSVPPSTTTRPSITSVSTCAGAHNRSAETASPGAAEARSAQIEHRDVGALAGLETADIVASEAARAFHRRHAQGVADSHGRALHAAAAAAAVPGALPPACASCRSKRCHPHRDPTGHPARRSAGTGAQPEPNRMLEVGQCAIPTPARPRRFTSLRLKKMPCASQVSLPSQPTSSSRSSGRLPNRLRQYASSSRVSARCVCRRTP